MDDDDLSGGMTFTFRLADGSPLTVTTGDYFKTHYGELFRSVRREHGNVEVIGFDARAADHPDVVAETVELRRRLRAGRPAGG